VLSVTATGAAPLSYRWQKNNVYLGSASASNELVLTSVKQSDTGSYKVVVSNDAGQATSSSVQLTIMILEKTKITLQPKNQIVEFGDSAEFVVGASGIEPLEYQWYKDGQQIAGATETIYRIVSVSQGDLGIYSVWAQNKLGRAYSQTVELSLAQLHTLTVASRDPDSGITVTVSPADLKGQSDGTTQFTRVYSKGAEVTLSAKQSVGDNQFKQWLANGAPVGTESTVTLTMDYDRTLRVVYVPKPDPPTETTGLVAHFSLDAHGDSLIAGQSIASTLTDVEFGLRGANSNTGTSARFNGVSSIIQHDWSADLNPESFTLSLWAKSDGGAGAWNSPVTSRHDLGSEGGTSKGYVIYDNDPSGVWTFWSGNGPDSGNWQVLDGPAVTLGEWEHIAITYDNVTELKKLFVNGEFATESNDSVFPNDTTPFNIGAGQDFGDGFWFRGDLDDIGLWNRALSQEEIQVAMEQGVAAFALGNGDGIAPPSITKQPSSVAVTEGETAVLSVTATGTRPLSYRWKKNNNYLGPVSASNELVLNNVKKSDAGNYKVVVSNEAGQVVSSTVQLAVNVTGKRALVLESNNDGYARVVQDVTIPVGKYTLSIICNSNYSPDKNNLPAFFRKKPSSVPDPQKTAWKTRNLNGGLFEHIRTLTFDQSITANITFSAINYLPIEFHKISLTNSSNKEILTNPEFVNDTGWKSEGGKISYKLIQNQNEVLRLAPVNLDSSGNLSIMIIGNSGALVELQYSTNLHTWKKLKTLTLKEGRASAKINRSSVKANKFYRVKLVD
jgi:hypothetical protein